MRRLFKATSLFVCLLLSMLVLAGLAAPIHLLFDSIGHFRFHFTALMMLALVVALIQKFRRMTVFMTLVGFWSLWSMFLSDFAMPTTPPVANPMKIVQFNLLFNNRRPGIAVDWILSQQPDVVTLQEVSKQNEVVLVGLQAKYPHQIECSFATVGSVAIVSRFPITKSSCRKGEGLVWARLDVQGKAVTIASLHLHWPYPYRQYQQIERFSDELQNMPRPVVLAGDFNAAPWSDAVHRISEATDTHVMPGLRFTLRMLPKPIGPLEFMPIDHILLPDGAYAMRADTGPQLGSDHLPVVASLVLN